MQAQHAESSTGFQIALLIEDIVEAKNISDGLREIGIFAHFYQSLDELWVSLNTYTPDLCIIDVKLMSQGTLLFKNHPKVQEDELKYAFYYKDSTKLLLNSTHGLNHYGLLRAEVDIVDQLKSILRRRNEELRLSQQNETMMRRVERLKMRGQRLSEAQEESHKLRSQHQRVKKLINQFGTVNSANEYLNRLITFFDAWEECESFGVYHLNSTGQKLIAPKAKKAKYKILPDLWLTSENENGIASYAQEMAFDVSYGLISDRLLTLKIYGTEENPDVIVVGHFREDQLENFEWDLLENKLNSEYRKALINFYRSESDKSSQQNIFDTFQIMDDIQYHQAKTDHKYVVVSFSKLVHKVMTNLENRFHWKSFAREFQTDLREILTGDFHIANLGVENFVISLDKKFIETDYPKLKAFLADFQLWRYFEDTSVVLTDDINPTAKFIAPAAVNVMRQTKETAAFDSFEEDYLYTHSFENRQIEI
ncbi:MAG: hypothetical protein CME62_11080 [Halobacteriovoraceae bacterium]|nr:hypothetical protein [Halobacteriovoraceae bacterium]